MNILVFSWRDIKHPKAGGAEQVMHEHAKGWVQVGHKVTHFSAKMEGLSNNEIIDGVKFIRSGYQYLGVIISGLFYYIKNRKNIDLVIDEFHGIPFFTPLYVKKPKLAVIQEVARKVWLLNPLPWPLNWVVGIIGFLGEPFIFLFYKSTPFITGSNSAKEAVSKFGIPLKNITVVPHGVIVNKGKMAKRKAKVKTIVYLGVLSRDKGIEDAIKCFKILSLNGEFQFWVIGRPETKRYGEKIKGLVLKSGLNGKIKFFGFVPQDKKFKLLSKAHILINPSAHEGWGLVNIEANSMGTPVVAYSSAGLVDSVKDGVSGLICSLNNTENLAEKILKMLDNENYYKELQMGSINWSKNFSWRISRGLSKTLIEKIANEI